jgi:hypothetical protein
MLLVVLFSHPNTFKVYLLLNHFLHNRFPHNLHYLSLQNDNLRNANLTVMAHPGHDNSDLGFSHGKTDWTREYPNSIDT